MIMALGSFHGWRVGWPHPSGLAQEVRALRWDHVVAYDDARQSWVPVSVAGWDHERFAIYVWRSVRAGGDTKTKKSRRTLALPKRCVAALRGHYDAAPVAARQGSRAVFTNSEGAPLDRHTALRAFRKVIKAAGLPPKAWAPREMRHSFVSLPDAAPECSDSPR